MDARPRLRRPLAALPGRGDPAGPAPSVLEARGPGGGRRPQGAAALAWPAGRRGAAGPARPHPRAGLEAGRLPRDRRSHHDRRRQPDPGYPGAHLRQPARLRPARAPRVADRDEPRGDARRGAGGVLHDADLASRGLRRLRRAGPRRPARLGHREPDPAPGPPGTARRRTCPGQREFDPQNKALGASYESAWLACRLLAEEYGEKKLIAFYRASDRADSTRGPFRSCSAPTRRRSPVRGARTSGGSRDDRPGRSRPRGHERLPDPASGASRPSCSRSAWRCRPTRSSSTPPRCRATQSTTRRCRSLSTATPAARCSRRRRSHAARRR